MPHTDNKKKKQTQSQNAANKHCNSTSEHAQRNAKVLPYATESKTRLTRKRREAATTLKVHEAWRRSPSAVQHSRFAASWDLHLHASLLQAPVDCDYRMPLLLSARIGGVLRKAWQGHHVVGNEEIRGNKSTETSKRFTCDLICAIASDFKLP